MANSVEIMEFNKTLIGPRIRLRPLVAEDSDALVRAASDGNLWDLPFTVVPSAETVKSYISTALAGREGRKCDALYNGTDCNRRGNRLNKILENRQKK